MTAHTAAILNDRIHTSVRDGFMKDASRGKRAALVTGNHDPVHRVERVTFINIHRRSSRDLNEQTVWGV